MKIETYEKIIKSKAGVLFITGVPGSGKSAIVREIADRNSWNFIDLRLGQLASEDLAGIPRPIDYKGTTVVEWALPKMLVKANDQPTLIFFDEIDRASVATLNASLQILNERTIGTEFAFNDEVYFCCAGNGSSDEGSTEELGTALMNRLVPVRHVLEFNDWKKWADGKVLSQVVDFLEARPGKIFESSENSDATASYRSWTNLSNYLKSVLGDSPSTNDLMNEVIEAGFNYVGTGAMAFKTYLEETAMVTVEDIVENWADVKKLVKSVPASKKSSLIHDFAEYKVDETTMTQKNNIVKFLKVCRADEVVFLIIKWLESSDDIKYLGHVKTIIKAYDPTDEFRKSILASME